MRFKKDILVVSLLLLSISVIAQTSQQKLSSCIVDVFIYKNKDIRIDGKLIHMNDVSKNVKNVLEEATLKSDGKVHYRIIADKNLALGYIMDVEHKMFEANDYNTSRKRYLLATKEMNKDIEVEGSLRLKKQ